MLLDRKMPADVSVDYYSESFRATLEALIPTYRADPATTSTSIPINFGIIYRAAFFDLLTALRVEPCYHWFVMRLNNFFSPMDFDEMTDSILMPDFGKLESVRKLWKTTQVIKT